MAVDVLLPCDANGSLDDDCVPSTPPPAVSCAPSSRLDLDVACPRTPQPLERSADASCTPERSARLLDNVVEPGPSAQSKNHRRAQKRGAARTKVRQQSELQMATVPEMAVTFLDASEIPAEKRAAAEQVAAQLCLQEASYHSGSGACASSGTKCVEAECVAVRPCSEESSGRGSARDTSSSGLANDDDDEVLGGDTLVQRAKSMRTSSTQALSTAASSWSLSRMALLVTLNVCTSFLTLWQVLFWTISTSLLLLPPFNIYIRMTFISVPSGENFEGTFMSYMDNLTSWKLVLTMILAAMFLIGDNLMTLVGMQRSGASCALASHMIALWLNLLMQPVFLVTKSSGTTCMVSARAGIWPPLMPPIRSRRPMSIAHRGR